MLESPHWFQWWSIQQFRKRTNTLIITIKSVGPFFNMLICYFEFLFFCFFTYCVLYTLFGVHIYMVVTVVNVNATEAHVWVYLLLVTLVYCIIWFMMILLEFPYSIVYRAYWLRFNMFLHHIYVWLLQ